MSKQNRDKKQSSPQQQRGNSAKNAKAGQPEEFQQNQAEIREQEYGQDIAEKHRQEQDSE